jgi:formylmethanofuran dehydrogenase subunit A
MAMHDLVIRGATVVDGLGHDPIRADVAVRDGRIAAIGEVDKDSAEIVDAGGLTRHPPASLAFHCVTAMPPANRLPFCTGEAGFSGDWEIYPDA